MNTQFQFLTVRSAATVVIYGRGVPSAENRDRIEHRLKQQ